MAKIKRISAERARQLLDYDMETGILRWKTRKTSTFTDGIYSAERRCRAWNGRLVGKRAGSLQHFGYIVLEIDGQAYFAHNIAWLIVTGEFPEDELDHKNGVRDDLKFPNLRPATRLQNQHNKKTYKNNALGLTGVWPHGVKYCASIQANGTRYFLGVFASPELAHEAYLMAKKDLHPFQPVPRNA